jgi:hypothetical protein
MSNFTPSVKFSTEFDGDTVTMSLYRLKKKHMMKMMPIIARQVSLSANDSEDEVSINLTEMLEAEGELSIIAESFIHEYVKDLSGLLSADGEKIDFETVLEQSYFQPLVAQIIKRLFEISKPSQEEIDKLGKQQESSSAA